MLRLRAHSRVAKALALAGASFCLASAIPSLAQAQERSRLAESAARVVLVTDDPSSEVALLLGAELSSLGFNIITVKGDPERAAPRELHQLARQQDAVAAFRVSVTSERVEVWIADRVTGKVTLREVIRPSAGEPLAARTIVLRAVELLRWSLQELRAPYPSRGEITEPPEQVTEFARASDRDQELGLAAAGYFSYVAGGSGRGAGVALSAALRLGTLGGRLEVGQPLVDQYLSNANGKVEVSARWASAELTWTYLAGAWFKPSLGFGAKVLSLELRGVVTEPLVGRSTRDYSIAPSLRPRLAVSPIRYLQVFAEGSLAWLLAETDVALATQPVGSLGPWLLNTGLGLQLALD